MNYPAATILPDTFLSLTPFSHSWKHKQNDWLKHDKGGPWNNGHMHDRRSAYELAIDICQERQEQFEYVYDSLIGD